MELLMGIAEKAGLNWTTLINGTATVLVVVEILKKRWPKLCEKQWVLIPTVLVSFGVVYVNSPTPDPIALIVGTAILFILTKVGVKAFNNKARGAVGSN